MHEQVKHVKIETGLSKNSDGTWNGHITLLWPDKPATAYYYPGEPGKPFLTDRDANAWCQQEVKNLCVKIAAKHKAQPRLISV